MGLIRFALSFKQVVLVLVALMVPALYVHATHLRAGEIVVERVNCQSLTFKITVTVYTNTGSSVLFGGRAGDEDILDFGDGTPWILVPETANTPRLDLGNNIGTASFTTFHTYASPGKYTISYREPNRNEGVLNMDNSVNTRFYLETQINIDPFLGCNNTPQLLVPPIDQACTGVAFFHNPGAFDPDGDSLSYELVVPFSDRNLPVIRYQDPSDNQPRQFYTNYNVGNEDADGPPDFSIDPVTGTILWNAPGAQGEYNIAFVVKEWRNINGQWVLLGFVRRDMQIINQECDNERPDVIVPVDTCIEAGNVLNATIFGIDPENHDVKIELFSEIFNFAPSASPATYSPFPPDFQASSPNPAEVEFEWNTQCSHVKSQPYQVVVKITDRPPTGPRLVTFKSWNITVVGPSPVWETVTLNPNDRSATLDWENYQCANADQIQIWRRVDSFPYDPANCETGMPEFLGYELIATLPLRDANNNPVSQFVDNNGGQGLAPGAEYCYRLVSTFPLPKGGESYMSEEFCIGPILADAPIITHVSVERTDQADGEIRVSWMPPFEADASQFPPPYSYQVFQAEGFAGETAIQQAHPGNISDTTILITGLNTEDVVYNFRVVCYDSTDQIVDTSAVASSVRLEAQSQLQRIELSWSALVPWSNQSQLHPRHLIYRGPEGATESELELIDSVNVTIDGMVYVDEGQYNGVPLEDDQVYCYRVMTRGSYGNPDIGEPLENFSQIICAQPSDTIPPCVIEVLLPVDAPNCEDEVDVSELCNQLVFSNTISWERPNAGDCQNDIASYNVYVAPSSDGQFVLFATNIKETTFVDSNLPSNARCYKVSAVDRSGNEGPLSEAICIDNCPYYELPNVFTPNNDNCNDVFSAYNVRPINNGEGGEDTPCATIPQDDRFRCARFVRSVDFRVFNRWGKEVYTYTSGGERTIFIDWDGRDGDGRELSTGVYYYIAEVVFDTSDPAKRNQTFKGWVHLLR